MVERAAIAKKIVSTEKVVAGNFEGNQRVNFEYLPNGVQVSFGVQFPTRTTRKCFRFEQWNCSTSHMKKLFKKLYRETAFIHSLAASAFVYTIAEACLNGHLENCKCASHANRDRPRKEAESVWGGCSVNPIFASRFVEKFLQLKKKGDNPSNIMKYNSQIGVRVARRSTQMVCKCHGLSGKNYITHYSRKSDSNDIMS